MELLCFLVLALWQTSEATHVTLEDNVNGHEISVNDWYEKSFSLEVEQQIEESEDFRCKLIISGVKAALFMKKIEGVLSKAQMSEAVRHFDGCRRSICYNSAMIDKFMSPDTFREQIDILVARAKMPELEEDKIQIIKNLVDGRYRDVLAEVPFPIYDQKKFHGQRYAAAKVIENVCGSQPNSDDIGPEEVTAMFLFTLVDTYTSDAIKNMDVENLTRHESVSEVWNGIADRVFSPTSNFATTCIDPAIAFYDEERLSVTRIREFAETLNVYCNIPVFAEEKSEMEFEEIELEFSMGAAPSSPGGGSAGAPGSTGGGSSFAPGSPGSNSGPRFRP